ncbi:MAG TPA: hypothetical protein VFJ02_15380, partial [Vicinamibacterales bacterium]|nr:hypothetical protein [Vicinamibacterales bacterium]
LGLFLLRVAAGSAALGEGAAFLAGRGDAAIFDVAAGLTACVIAMALLIGLFTPAAGLLAAAGTTMALLAIIPLPPAHLLDDGVAASLMLAISMSIVLLGPGALSIDSYLFGRREILIPCETRK